MTQINHFSYLEDNRLTSGEMLSNDRRAVDFDSSQLGPRDASIGRVGAQGLGDWEGWTKGVDEVVETATSTTNTSKTDLFRLCPP